MVQPIGRGAPVGGGWPAIAVAALAPSLDALRHCAMASALRILPTIMRQPPEIRDRIRAAVDALCAVHRRADGSYAIAVAIQVAQGRQP